MRLVQKKNENELDPLPPTSAARQLDEAVSEQKKFQTQLDQTNDVIRSKRAEAELLAPRIASGDTEARKRSLELRKYIADVIDVDLAAIESALKTATDNVSMLTAARNQEIVAVANAASIAEVQRRLEEVLAADREFFAGVAAVAKGFERLRRSRQQLLADEMRQPGSTAGVFSRLSASHDAELESLLRELGGPSSISADVDAEFRVSRAVAVYCQRLFSEWLVAIQKGAL